MDRLKILKRHIEFLIDAFHNEGVVIRKYILENSTTIIKGQEELNKRIENATKYAPEFADEVLNYLEDDILQYHHLYPNLFYNSAVIWLYSFFENNLKSVCEFVERTSKQEIKIKDFGNRGIERYEKYLRLVHGVKSEKLESTWSRIQKYEVIRNLIVHNNSSLINNREIKEVEKQPKYNVVSNMNYVVINSTDCTFKITDAKLLIELHDLISEYIVGVWEEFDKIITMKIEAKEIKKS